ncbi:MAG: DUF2298 domain-containing protein [Chloroflexia bacterium]
MGALLLWWLLVEFLGLLALPLTLLLFRNLPDRGYPLARLVGILLPSFLAWFLGMWQLASYGPALLAGSLFLLAVLSGWLLLRERGILPFLREHRRYVLGMELFFALALLGGAFLRIYGGWGGSAINHTEQPSDLALLNGILQSRTLPPQDPWLSGYTINYYYFGYFLAASLTLLSGLPSSITFNLNLALLFALTATGCFSLGYNLTLAMAPARRRALVVGGLAVLFALFAGNQVGALQVLTGSNQAAPLRAEEVWIVLWARLHGETDNVALGKRIHFIGNDFGGGFEEVRPTVGRQIADFDWWWPSRALWDEQPNAAGLSRIQDQGVAAAALLNWRAFVGPEESARSYAITEFPFFSFYLGDMHPHVMALPLGTLALALALNVLLSPERGRPGLAPGRWGWFFLALNAILLGSLYVTNSWDFPTYLLLYLVAWYWRWRKEVSGPWTTRDSFALLRDLGSLVALSILFYLPFYLTFRSFAGGRDIPAAIAGAPIVDKIVGLPILSQFFRTVGPVLWDKTPLYTIGVIFGLFLYPALSWLAAKAFRERVRWGIGYWAGLALALAIVAAVSAVLLDPARPFLFTPVYLTLVPAFILLYPLLARLTALGLSRWGARWDGLLLAASLAAAVGLGVYLHFPLLLVLPLLALGWRLLRNCRPAEAMVLLMLLLALLLLLGCEIFYIRDIFDNRMNTVFKFYYQVWMLLAVAGAWAAGEVGHTYLRRPLPAVLWALPLLLLLSGALVYPALTLRQSFSEAREWNLDGLAYMARLYPGDYAGVRWLSENAEPDAVILEAVVDAQGGSEWGYTGRVSATTGRPTLLAWKGHEDQWRWGDPEAYASLGIRFADAQRLYETTDLSEARRLLEQYGVDYVFIGSLEARYAAESLAKFAQLGRLAFEAPGLQIYRIER